MKRRILLTLTAALFLALPGRAAAKTTPIVLRDTLKTVSQRSQFNKALKLAPSTFVYDDYSADGKTYAMDDIGGPPGLEGFIKELKKCKLKGTEDDPDCEGDWRIQEWGYDDPMVRRKFLTGPTLEELTELLRNEITRNRERTARRKEEEERERLFKNVGRNDPCPCGSGKKFKKCCGMNR